MKKEELVTLHYKELYFAKKRAMRRLGLEHWDPEVEEDKEVKALAKVFNKHWFTCFYAGGDPVEACLRFIRTIPN